MFVVVCVLAIFVGFLMLHDADPATHARRVGLISGVLAATSLAATLAYLAIMSVLHVLPTGYNPIRQAVSDYGSVATGRCSPLRYLSVRQACLRWRLR